MDKETEIKIFNHGYVKVIDWMGSDEYVIRAARQSTGKGFQGWDKDAPLLKYLYSHKHMTPFEMSDLIIEVKAPIFVFREWHRHRTMSYNEFSARYSVMPDEHYLPEFKRVQTQDQVNKQGSGVPLDGVKAASIVEELERDQKSVYKTYNMHLADGVAKEVARINTPVARYSKMWAKSNLRNWLNFLQLRKASDAQMEIRAYADAVSDIVRSLWPRTYELFEEYTLNAKTFSASEVQLLTELLRDNPGLRMAQQAMGVKAHAELLGKLGLNNNSADNT